MKRKFAVVISVVIAVGFVGGSLVAVGVAGPQDLPLVTASMDLPVATASMTQPVLTASMDLAAGVPRDDAEQRSPTPPARAARTVTVPDDVGDAITLPPSDASRDAIQLLNRLFGREENPTLQAFNAGEGKMPVKQSKKISMLLGE